MAGFEGPRDPGADDAGATKLPSWAVTRKEPEPDLGPGAAGVPGAGGSSAGAGGAGRGAFTGLGGSDLARGQRPEPPVARVPEHPFDVDDPFGDNQLGGVSSPWIRPPADDTEVRVVDLADEFHLTTAQALEVCEAAGAPAESGAAWLTVAQADAFRAAVVGYDRSASSDESFPEWAIPPGGRRPAAPVSRPVAARPVPDPPPPAVVPAAVVADDAPADPVPPGPDRPKTSALRLALLVLSVLAIVVLLAVLLTR